MRDNGNDGPLTLDIMYQLLGRFPIGLKCEWIDASKCWILLIHKPKEEKDGEKIC